MYKLSRSIRNLLERVVVTPLSWFRFKAMIMTACSVLLTFCLLLDTQMHRRWPWCSRSSSTRSTTRFGSFRRRNKTRRRGPRNWSRGSGAWSTWICWRGGGAWSGKARRSAADRRPSHITRRRGITCTNITRWVLLVDGFFFVTGWIDKSTEVSFCWFIRNDLVLFGTKFLLISDQ